MRYPKPGYPNPTVSIYVFDLDLYLSLPERPSTDATDFTKSRLEAATRQLQFESSFDEAILTEVAWVSSTDLMVKQTDRFSTHLKVAHFDLSNPSSAVGKVVRDVDFEAIDGGWVDPQQTVKSIRVAGSSLDDALYADLPTGYLEIGPDDKGFRHVALYETPDASEPIFLTSGDWEVAEGIESVDLKRRLM